MLVLQWAVIRASDDAAAESDSAIDQLKDGLKSTQVKTHVHSYSMIRDATLTYF